MNAKPNYNYAKLVNGKIVFAPPPSWTRTWTVINYD